MMAIFFKIIFFAILFYHNVFSFSNGIWVVRDALKSDENILQIISTAKELNCKKIFLQFRALGKVYYPTKLNIPNYKVNERQLLLLFEEAQKNNIEIHAWLNVCYIWQKTEPPKQINHIYYKSILSKIETIPDKIKSEGYYLHPNDSANLSELIAVIKELKTKYNISGVHLDYFRYPKNEKHTSKRARTDFLIKYGLDPLLPLSNPKEFVQNRGYKSYRYFQNKYHEYLRNELNSALVYIREQTHLIDENLELSVAVKPDIVTSKHRFMQDWLSWIKNDLCDFVVLMNYNPKMPKFVNNIKLLKEIHLDSKVMVGIATYNIKPAEVLQRIDIVNNYFNEWVLFSYNYIIKNKYLFGLLKNRD
jgi:uncharacterized lipoprotein YddW (UPF0748 family)